MNRALRLESLLRLHGNSATLSLLLRAMDMRSLNNLDEEDGRAWLGVRHRFSASVSELRADPQSRTPMETLVWTKGKTPGEGVYSILPARVEGGVVVSTSRGVFTHECGGSEDIVGKLEMGGGIGE